MAIYSEALQALRNSLLPLYDAGEATAIAREVMACVTGKTYTENLICDQLVDSKAEERMLEIRSKLLTGMPMQYALGVAWFLNRPYTVNRKVLIPRPETEELVQWIVNDYKNKAGLTILDIGTGSGCIPISLALSLNAQVISCDISADALCVAVQNAGALKAEVQFVERDFLDATVRAGFGQFDLIVSNPPYIPAGERAGMPSVVTDYEPYTALFVPDTDPQFFYRPIASFGMNHLKAGGVVYCELHQDYAQESGEVFRATGYKEVILKKDLNGHCRMLKAYR